MPALVSFEPARARVRRDEREPCRELDLTGHPRHDDPPVFERLTQRLDGVPAKLRKLVEEQHAVVRECSDMSPGVRRHLRLRPRSRT
jgi:hypothetical protein